jgi:hypothetical protein
MRSLTYARCPRCPLLAIAENEAIPDRGEQDDREHNARDLLDTEGRDPPMPSSAMTSKCSSSPKVPGPDLRLRHQQLGAH